VLHVSGSPAEMGQGHGRLLRREFRALRREYLEAFVGDQMKSFLKASQAFEPFIPPAYREELRELARGSRCREADALLANTFLDLSRAARCSVVIVAGEALEHGRLLLARNLDFPSHGIAHKATVLKAYHHGGRGLHSFVAIGWPGMLGLLSGMNDAGLCVATLISYSQKGVEPGLPYPMLYRRILEECATPEAAERLVREAPRTCANSLAVAAPKREPLIIEFTPERVAVRRPERGVLVATNQFRSPEQVREPTLVCERFATLERLAARHHGRIGVATLQEMLRAVQMTEARQGAATLQSMVFEPETRRLHLSVGHLPAAEGTYVTIDCAELLAGE
jgi:predicted choloylglycine hydrolase